MRSLYRVSGPRRQLAVEVMACPGAEVLAAFLIANDLVDAYVHVPCCNAEEFLGRCDHRGWPYVSIIKKLSLSEEAARQEDDHEIDGWETDGGR